MAEDGRDMLIWLQGPGGPFPGEGKAVLLGTDPLTKGFNKHFFSDVQGFDFSVGLEDPAKKDSKDKGGKVKITGPDGKPMEGQLAAEKRTAGFEDFMRGGNKAYGSDLQPFTFEKLFDVASLSIFNACATSQTLPSVTLVKRKALGEATLMGYLRFQFFDVLITDLDWDEEKVIKEKVKFICRKVRVQYFSELNNGTLDKTLPFKEWSMRNVTQGA